MTKDKASKFGVVTSRPRSRPVLGLEGEDDCFRVGAEVDCLFDIV